MRAHVIENGVVANTIKVSALNQFPGMSLIDADVHGGGIGWTWNGSVLSPPAAAPEDTAPFYRSNHQSRIKGKIRALENKLKKQVAADDLGALATQLKINQLKEDL